MKEKRTFWWIALIALGGCAKTASLPEQPKDDPSARTTTAVNPPSTPQEMAAKCDVPFYAGAKAPDGMSRMPRQETDGTHYELVLTTRDTPRKVADFYSKALKLPVISLKGALSIVGRSPHKNDVIVEFVSEGGQTVIRIHSIAYKST